MFLAVFMSESVFVSKISPEPQSKFWNFHYVSTSGYVLSQTVSYSACWPKKTQRKLQ